MHMEVREVNQHAGFQDNRFSGSHKPRLSFDDPQRGRHTWVETINLHDNCVEIWHLGSDGDEGHFVDRLDLSKKLSEDVRTFLQLDQGPGDIRANAVMAACHVSV